MAEGGGALRELIAMLTFDVDSKPLEKADEKLKGTLETAKRVGEALAIALGVHELGEFVQGQIEMGAQLEHTSMALGITTDKLQEFQYAAATVGVDTESANTALKFMERTLGEASQGNAEAAQTFSRLHVATKNADGSARDMTDVLGDVAEGFKGISDPAQRTATAMKIFGRSGTTLIPLLRKGRDGVEALKTEFAELGGGLSDQFIEDAEEAEHGMVMLRTAGKGLSSEIGAVLLPYVADLAGAAAHLVAKFREVTQHTNIVRNTLITLAAIAGVLVVIWGIMNIEILIVVAALALLAIAVDDVITFVEGGDSVLGRFLDQILGIGASKKIAGELKDAWKEVSEAFGKLWDAVKDLGPTLKDLFVTFTTNKGGLDNTKTGIQSLADSVSSLVTGLTSAVTAFDNLLKKADEFAKAHPLLIHAVERQVHQVSQGNVGVFGAASSALGDVREALTGNTEDVDAINRGAPTGTTQVPSFSAPGTITLGTIQQQQTNHVTFNGVAGAADAVTKLNQTMRDSQQEALNAAYAATPNGRP